MKKKLAFSLFIIIKLCTVSALCSSRLCDYPEILNATAKFLYSGGINTKHDAKNYARLNEAVAGDVTAKKALEESYMKGYIESLMVYLIAPHTACIDNAYIDKLARLHPELTRLDFSKCDQITDKTLSRWAVRFSKLRSVNLANSDITNLAIIALAENCPELRDVELSFCDNVKITDAVVFTLAKAFPGLEELHLRGTCEDSSRIDFVRNSKKMWLCIHDEITDAVVIAFAKGCPGLKVVWLDCCDITDAAVIALAENCPELELVNLIFCEQFTENAHLNLNKSHPALEINNYDG